MENYFQAEAFNLDKVLDEFEQNEGEPARVGAPGGRSRGMCVSGRIRWGNSHGGKLRASGRGAGSRTETGVIEGARSGSETNYITGSPRAFLKLCYWFKVFLFPPLGNCQDLSSGLSECGPSPFHQS